MECLGFFICRCNFLLNNVIDKVLLLTQRREKYLVVAAVRFVRTILSRHVSLILFEHCCTYSLSLSSLVYSLSFLLPELFIKG